MKFNFTIHLTRVDGTNATVEIIASDINEALKLLGGIPNYTYILGLVEATVIEEEE